MEYMCSDSVATLRVHEVHRDCHTCYGAGSVSLVGKSSGVFGLAGVVNGTL